MLDITGNNEYPINREKIGCHACRSALCFPDNLTEEELAKFDGLNITKKHMERGDVLYRANEKLTKIYVVRTGSYKASISDSKGIEQIVDYFLPGDIIGLDTLSDVLPLSRVTALETSSVCEISEAGFSKIHRTHPAMRSAFMKTIGHKIKQEQQKMMLIAQMNSEARLASFLINLGSRFHERGFSATEFNLSMQRHEIANYIGLAPASLSRALTDIQRKGYVKANRNNIKILDFDGLSKLSCLPRCTRNH